MNEKNTFSSADIEAQIAAAGDKFTLASIAKALGAARSDTLRRRLERFIESDVTFFHDRKWNCIKRNAFFNNKQFIITPDEWEIQEGVLFPGHRFIPFVSEDVFPSEIDLKLDNDAAAKRKLTLPLGKIFHYHLLLGSEQIFDFLIAEDPANAHLANHHSSNEPVSLEVFDLSKFYHEHDFALGDAICCQVKDYDQGVVECTFLAAGDRQFSARKERISALDEAIKLVWEEFKDYPDIPEQLAWAEYYCDRNVSSAGASIDEFITSSTMVELRADGDHAVLSIREENNETSDVVLPEGLSISNSSLDDPIKLLSGNGIPLTEAELDGFMLDAISRRESDIDGVYSRIFAHRELDMADEAQQAVLLNYLEERFEELMENYNRADDEPKAELRADLLEAVQQRMEYLAYLGSLDRDVNDQESAKLKKLAGISTKLNEAIKLLNNPAFTPDETELEHLSTLVDAGLDEQEELLGTLHSSDENDNQ